MKQVFVTIKKHLCWVFGSAKLQTFLKTKRKYFLWQHFYSILPHWCFGCFFMIEFCINIFLCYANLSHIFLPFIKRNFKLLSVSDYRSKSISIRMCGLFLIYCHFQWISAMKSQPLLEKVLNVTFLGVSYINCH